MIESIIGSKYYFRKYKYNLDGVTTISTIETKHTLPTDELISNFYLDDEGKVFLASSIPELEESMLALLPKGAHKNSFCDEIKDALLASEGKSVFFDGSVYYIEGEATFIIISDRIINRDMKSVNPIFNDGATITIFALAYINALIYMSLNKDIKEHEEMLKLGLITNKFEGIYVKPEKLEGLPDLATLLFISKLIELHLKNQDCAYDWEVLM